MLVTTCRLHTSLTVFRKKRKKAGKRKVCEKTEEVKRDMHMLQMELSVIEFKSP